MSKPFRLGTDVVVKRVELTIEVAGDEDGERVAPITLLLDEGLTDGEIVDWGSDSVGEGMELPKSIAYPLADSVLLALRRWTKGKVDGE